MDYFKGLDLSRYQGNVDFKKVKEAGYTFVILQIGYGRLASQKDIKFETYYNDAKAAGLEIGGYWYCHARDVDTAVKEANACLECINGRKFSYPIYYDVEEVQNIGALTNETNTAIVNTFCNKIQQAGYVAGFYSFEGILNHFYINRIPYEKWLAKWSNSMGNNSTSVWKMWQHAIVGTGRDATIKGTVPGLTTDVDEDYSYYDYTKKTGISFATNSTVVKESATTPVKPEPTKTNDTITTGSAITLSNTALFVTAYGRTRINSITGKYYVYSKDVINNRVRITNSAANVGKTPIGNYVTGWVNVSDIINVTNNTTTTTPVTPAPTAQTSNKLAAGTRVCLNNTPIYANSSTTNISNRISAYVYIYSSDISNNRIRITNSVSNVGKMPIGMYVTGWVNISDIK